MLCDAWQLYSEMLVLQVLKVKVELISYLAMNSVFTKRSVECCLADLVDKVGDVKNGSAVYETLSCLAECTSLDYIAMQVGIAS